MVPYLLLFILAFACAATDVYPMKNKWVLVVPFIAVMFVMVAFRDGLGGTDYTMYKYFYSKVVSLPEYLQGHYVPHYRTKTFEVGFVTFSSIIRIFDTSKTPYVYMFSIAVINVVLLFSSVRKYTPYIFLALLFYMYKAYFWHEFTLLRQSIAIGLFMYSIQYIKSRDPLKYFAINLLGMSMHASAIILLPLYFFVGKRYDDFKIFMIVAIAFLLNVLGPNIFYLGVRLASFVGMANRFSTYFIAKSINPLNFLEILFVLFVALNRRKFYEEKEPYFNIFLNLFVISSFLIIAFSSFEIFARFKEYFVVAYMILFSYFIGHIKDTRTKTAAFMLFTAYCFAGYIRYLYTFHGGSLLPYKWILF